MAIDVETEHTALALAAAKERIAELQAELGRYKANANVGICLWCSEKVPKTEDSVRAHLVSCSEHPMRALEREVHRLRSAWICTRVWPIALNASSRKPAMKRSASASS